MKTFILKYQNDYDCYTVDQFTPIETELNKEQLEQEFYKIAENVARLKDCSSYIKDYTLIDSHNFYDYSYADSKVVNGKWDKPAKYIPKNPVTILTVEEFVQQHKKTLKELSPLKD